MNQKLQYKRAVMLAASLTRQFNKDHYSYSGALWGAHEIFRKKKLLLYGIHPDVKILADGKIVVQAKLEVKK